MPKGGVGAVVAPALAVVAMIAMAYLMVGFYNHFAKTILVQAISRDLRFFFWKLLTVKLPVLYHFLHLTPEQCRWKWWKRW